MELEIQYMLPLILISFFSITAIVLDAIFLNKKFSYIYSIIGLVLVFATSVFSFVNNPQPIIFSDSAGLITKNMIKFGGFPWFFDALFSLAGILTLFSSRQYIKREYKELNEYYTLLLLSISGMMLICHSNNLLVLFIGIEVMSVSFYVLAGFFRNSIKSIEAAIKYFLLGAFATGFLVYGIALIYGATSSVDLTVIAQKVSSGQFTNLYFVIGFGLILIGLSFKVAAFPFHQWAPDVYQGSPTVVTGFMSTAGKAAALAGFIVVAKALMPVAIINDIISHNTKNFQLIIAIISAATMLIGNFTALVQKNVKRMLAFSSVAHAGYLLMGIVSNSVQGWQGIIFYSTAYLFMQLGAFTILSIFEKENDKNLELSDYAGLSKSHPMLSAMMAIFMLSLAGIPPFAGFFGKYYLFVSTIKADYTWLTIIAVISSIISMYFYIGLILQMYFKDRTEEPMTAEKGLPVFAVVLCAVGILVFGIFPQILTNLFAKFF